MTYRAIDPTELDPEAPLVSELFTALAGNPLAIAEDDPTAPKIRRRLLVSNAAALTQTFIGLGDYSGVEFFIFAIAGGSGAGAGTFNFSYSTDNGASFAANTTILSGLSGSNTLKGAFDFATGIFRIVGSGPSVLIRNSLTISGASLNINAVRFNTPGTGAGHDLTLNPNGGIV